MNILIDATQFPIKKTGVGVYAVNLIHAIIEADLRNHYTIVIQDDEHAFDDATRANVELVRYRARIFRKFFLRFFLEQILIPYQVLKQKIDVIHSLHYSFPLLVFGKRRVVTIHDMTFFKFPEVHERIKVFYFRCFILLAARLANRSITDSESTRSDYISRTGVSPETVIAIHLGSPNMPRLSGKTETGASVRRRLGIKGDFILFIGTMEPRKNLFRLILAFTRLIAEKTTCQLVIMGQEGWGHHAIFKLIKELGIDDHIIFTGYLSDTDKWQLLKSSTLFVYPSLYEGFGLPLLEALALGLPTVTSNVSSLPEVAGKGAIKVDPYDTDAIYRAIKNVLSDKKLRSDLAVKAKQQARQFTWQATALKTIKVYEAVGNQ